MRTSMVCLEVSEGIARITLNRPEYNNILNTEGIARLADIADRLARDCSLRAVLITGSGEQAFCAGGDVPAFDPLSACEPDLLMKASDPLNAAIHHFSTMDAPIVVGINGLAAGIGLSLVAMADLAIAVDHARFHVAHTQIGYTPGGGTSWTLPRTIGVKRAKELFLTGRSLNADEALEWGLVSQVVRADRLQEVVNTLLRGLARGPTRCYGAVKRLLLASEHNALAAHLDLETRATISQSQNPEGKELIRAFVERRQPVFLPGQGLSSSNDSGFLPRDNRQ